MHARDLAQILVLMLKKIFVSMNVATNENYTVNEIAKIALKACGVDKFEIKYDNSKPNGQFRKDVDINILKSYFPDFNPIKLSEGIREIFKKRYLG